MVYFKRVDFLEYTKSDVMHCVKKVSIKSAMPLDFDFSYINIGTDKSFFAREGKNGLMFTRIKTSFEKILPKLISKLSAEANESYCNIRLSLLSTIIFLSVTLVWFSCLLTTIFGDNLPENLIIVSIIALFYIALLWLEIRLTTAKIDKAIKRLANANY